VGKVESSTWPRRFRTYWCVVDGQGTAYLVSASLRRENSVRKFLQDADKPRVGWPWWRRHGYSCQRVDIKVRNAKVPSHGR
jgi:hypothetical protein